MQKEKSCGAVLFHKLRGILLFLLLKYKNDKDYWSLCKGHMEHSESEKDTARREIREESGIDVVDFLYDFRETIMYSPGPNIIKEVVFFLAHTPNMTVKLFSGEHVDYVWLPFKEALQRLTYEKDQQVMIKAHQYILKHEYQKK